jgi:hypothetical protein
MSKCIKRNGYYPLVLASEQERTFLEFDSLWDLFEPFKWMFVNYGAIEEPLSQSLVYICDKIIFTPHIPLNLINRIYFIKGFWRSLVGWSII